MSMMMMMMMVKVGLVVSEIIMGAERRTDRQTDKQTYSSQYFALHPGGKVISDDVTHPHTPCCGSGGVLLLGERVGGGGE